MKRTFLKVLPFAAALLLATSCSKDENNSTDEIVNNGGEQIETVVKTFKTLTVKGKVNKSISKVTTNDAGTGLAFEGNEVFTFGDEGDDVYGTINFTKSDGSYEATINYTDEQYLNDNFIATLGENPALISDAYDNLAIAVQHACYTIDFNIVQGDEGYKLQSENSADIIVNLQSAFIKALSDESNTLGGEGITVKEGKYYVIPSGLVMGSGSSETVAGKVYKLGKSLVLPGAFTVNSEGKKVYFSTGNLQATTTDNGTTWAWGFASNQYDYIGNATANTSINGNGTVSTNGTVDLFGWVGASSTWTAEGAIHGISNSTTQHSTSTYGNGYNESLKSDWGNVFGEGSPWFTLTKYEWTYLFNTRTTTSTIRYAMAQVNNVNGVILLPDNWSSETYTLTNTNTSNAAFTTNTIDATNWSTLEAAGAVFLPAAGYRLGESVDGAGSTGYYWSGTARGTSDAYIVYCESGYLYSTDDYGSRLCGFSVRLVRCMN